MPRIEADFSKISSSFEPFPAGDFQFHIEDVVMGETRNKNPRVEIKMSCTDPRYPEMDGKPYTDFIVLRQNDGKPNKVGLGQLKAYAEATIGEEAANDPTGIDTDELKGSDVILVLKQRTWVPDKTAENPNPEPRLMNEVAKVLPVG